MTAAPTVSASPMTPNAAFILLPNNKLIPKVKK